MQTRINRRRAHNHARARTQREKGEGKRGKKGIRKSLTARRALGNWQYQSQCMNKWQGMDRSHGIKEPHSMNKSQRMNTHAATWTRAERMAIMRSDMALSSASHTRVRAGSDSTVETRRAPCSGGLEYMGRTTALSWDSTFVAVP